MTILWLELDVLEEIVNIAVTRCKNNRDNGFIEDHSFQ